MKIIRLIAGLAVVIVALVNGASVACGGTNGFIVPSFRGSANSQFGYWESFTVPVGPPGNLPDQAGATTAAVLTQSNASAFIISSGNLYNPAGISSFTLADSTPITLSSVVLQTRTGGSELDYNSVSLTYSDTNGTHSLAPLFRYELNRVGIPGQGASVSSLWQWDLTGLVTSNYSISFNASGSSLSFDSMTLDTTAPIGTNFIDSAAFWQQPFKLQSQRATLARWNYIVSYPSLTTRPTASVFGAISDAPDFDARDAQYLLGWSTTNRIPAGQGTKNYLIRRARVTLTISAGNQYVYTGTLPDYRTYFPTNDPRHLPPTTPSAPIELFGAGFRGGFTNGESVFVPWASTNYPQTGPWAAGPEDVYRTNRVAFAAGFDTNGALVDVSNNVGDDGTNEVANPFEVAPFAVGQTTNVAEGQLMPTGSQLTFEVNLNDPQIYGYVQEGLNDGNLSFMVSSLVRASMGGPPTFPAFYTIFSPIAAPGQFPLLDIEGEIVRPNLDSDGDSLSDDWENFYFGSLINSATGDLDSDSVSNLGEYQAGTIPTASASAFRLLSIQTQTVAAELCFTFAPGRQYFIQHSDDLQNWQIGTNAAVTYSSAWLAKSETNPAYPSPVFAVWRDTNAAGQQRFYRVGAQ